LQVHYINKSFKIKSEASAFLVDIFNLCAENNFIHKVSAGKLFKKLIDNSEFNAYSKRMKKEVFIDTPVLIYLLMASREPDLEYDNNKFKIARDLFNLIQNDTQTALYSTTDLYVLELADYIKSTIKLIPFEKLGVFKSLGGSNNEILNLYSRSKEDGFFVGNFSDYIESFGISISHALKNDRYLEQYLIKHFKNNFIQVDEVYHYDNDYKSKENHKYYDKIEKTLFEIYEDKGISRKLRSVKFDCLLFMHIYFLDEELIDPTILTWDNTFNEFRKIFQPQYPNLRYWHLFRPGKFLDHISLIKFKINGSSISNEILSIIETDFEVVEGVKKLADILNSIIDLKSETGTKLTVGLAKIRDTYVYKLNKNQNIEIELIEKQPVDEIVSNLVLYYSSNKGEFSFEDFTIALRDKNIIKELLKILNNETDYYLTSGNLSEKYKSNVDNLIKEFFKEKE